MRNRQERALVHSSSCEGVDIAHIDNNADGSGMMGGVVFQSKSVVPRSLLAGDRRRCDANGENEKKHPIRKILAFET